MSFFKGIAKAIPIKSNQCCFTDNCVIILRLINEIVADTVSQRQVYTSQIIHFVCHMSAKNEESPYSVQIVLLIGSVNDLLLLYKAMGKNSITQIHHYPNQ